MQEARGSSPLSSTFLQVRAYCYLQNCSLSACNPASCRQPESLSSPKRMQVRRVLMAGARLRRLPSLSDSQTDCQWAIRAPPGEDGIARAALLSLR
jgi:hypothetical protein